MFIVIGILQEDQRNLDKKDTNDFLQEQRATNAPTNFVYWLRFSRIKRR